MPTGIKHLIQCHCILPQYRNKKNPVFHKFVVFSIIDDSDTCKSKIVNCNNCGISHRVYDLCKSELLTGNEDTRSVMKKEDFKLSLPSSLYDLLNSYNCEIHDWEHVLHIFQNNLWYTEDCFIILSRDTDEDSISGKLLRITGAGAFRIEPYMYNTVVKQ